MPQKLIAFINASAGTAKAMSKTELRDALSAAFAKHGLDAEIRMPSGADLAGEVMAARAAGYDGVIAGGGDGTIRTAAAALAGSKVALGVLPLGTLNHFAKDLGLPLKLEDAIGTIAAGHIARIDVGAVNDEIFINNSSIGIYPFLVLDRERIQEGEGRKKWYAALLAAVRAFRRFPLRKLRIRVESETSLHKSPVVFIGNNEYGLERSQLGKRERLDQGELSVHIAKVETRAGFLALVLRGMVGRLHTSRDLITLKANFVEITSRTSRMPVALDGEVEILTPPLRYVSRRQALKVYVPEEEA